VSADDERTIIVPDPEHTILMPSPGGQATLVMPRPEAPPQPRAARTATELQRLVAGINPLLGAANTLLALVEQLRSTTSHADPGALREQLLDRVKEFEALARANGVAVHQISAARYLLCSFLDEVVAGTPWGNEPPWSQRNLLQEFHDERSGGEKAFKLLERLGEDVKANHDLLELFCVCLSLGFEGRWRGVRGGREQLEGIAERVLDQVHPARGSPASRALSQRWEGVRSPGSGRLSVLPLWAVFATGAAVVLGAWLLANARLDALAQPLFRRIHEDTAALRAERLPAAAAGIVAAARPRLAPLLQADVASGALQVRDEPARSIVTLPADELFEGGSARLQAGRIALLGRIAQALKTQPGVVVAVGHTDNSPTASLQFPSNWHLSRERAQAVVAQLTQQGLAVDRTRAEGRADAEPRGANDTPEGRSRNRRIEIELLLPRPDA
jgi:type VI secretion system protein ImpK